MLDISQTTAITSPVSAGLMDFADDILSATRYSEVIEQTSRFFKSIGITAVNLGHYPSDGGPMIGFSSTMRQDWLDQYVADALYEVDPFLMHFGGSNHVASFGWRRDFAVPPDGTTDLRVYDGCLSSGYANILFVPVKPKGEQISACVSVSNDMRGNEAERHLDAYGEQLALAAVLAGQRAIRVFSRDHLGENWFGLARPPLTPREREIICWLAAGMRTDQIAFRLDIKPVTVHMHIKSARHKTGAKTREQLVATAILDRLL